MSEILVYIEQENGKISENSLDLISLAKEISKGRLVSGVLIQNDETNFDKNELKKYGLDGLYIINSDLLEFDKRKHPYFLIELIKKKNPEIFILNSTTEGREIAPIVSSTLNTGLTADCTKISIVDDKLISTRPTFGGKLMADILCKNQPQMATVRVNTFKKKEFEINGELNIEEYNFNDINFINLKNEILNYTKEKSADFYNLQNSRIVLGGGMGLKNKENFERLKYLADLMGAKVGATRKAVDNGLIEKECQIGQTGVTITPELYIAFGISGAIHHTVGIENSKKIISINTDKNAPIFNVSDVGIIEDAMSVIEKLIVEFEKP